MKWLKEGSVTFLNDAFYLVLSWQVVSPEIAGRVAIEGICGHL